MSSNWESDLNTSIQDAQKGIEDGISEQRRKYGDQRITALAWIAVIAEEFGEMVAEYNKKNIEEFEMEAAQTIACITRLIHEVRREHSGQAEQEADMYVRHS